LPYFDCIGTPLFWVGLLVVLLVVKICGILGQY
jgi:hypothetical protein